MRIILDQAVHDHKNKGNNALLEVALNRLRKYWPKASFEVISIAPHFCKTYIPGTHPVRPENLQEFRSKLELLHRLAPKPLWRLIFELREILHRHTRLPLTPEKLRLLVLSWLGRDNPWGNQEMNGEGPVVDIEPAEGYETPASRYSNIADYDLYVATGGGYMCDIDKPFLLPLFDRLEAAVAHGVPAVMVGQGVGPIEDPELLKRAGEVLPIIDYIMIREERVARPLLDSLNVPSGKVIMTGDDAIELGYQNCSSKMGTGIGLSVRVARYTEVNEIHLKAIRPVIHQAATKYRAELIAVPIDVNEADINYIAELMKGYNKTSSSWRKFEAPVDIIKRVRRCRVMIGGTFHGAVFAISQGIPVVALAKSAEYYNKLAGLTVEFGNKGCQVIRLDDVNVAEKLSEAIDVAWLSAEQLRPQLLKSSKSQIDLGYAAYQKIFEVVETRRREKEVVRHHQL